MIPQRLRLARGFTLIEMAVVLAIFGLVIGLLMVPLSTQMEQQRIGETQKQLEHIRDALLGFAVATGRLPCPATPTTASTVAGAGLENKPAAACALSAGVIPWTVLGVPETDAWGNRFTYRVTASFADDPAAGMQASFLITDSGDITVTNGSANIATTLAGMVLSHGTNARGAYRSDGTQMAGAAGDELENADGDSAFVSRAHAPNFDDLLIWISPNVLKSRMVAAQRLP
jgi:prepilin-type N-terminal cleavage/methylation domain-containing protein